MTIPTHTFAAAAAKPRRTYKKKWGKPFSFRLTEEERVLLEQLAEGVPLGRYVRWKLFSGVSPKPARIRRRVPVKDHRPLAELLAKLGQTHLSSNASRTIDFLTYLSGLAAVAIDIFQRERQCTVNMAVANLL